MHALEIPKEKEMRNSSLHMEKEQHLTTRRMSDILYS